MFFCQDRFVFHCLRSSEEKKTGKPEQMLSAYKKAEPKLCFSEYPALLPCILFSAIYRNLCHAYCKNCTCLHQLEIRYPFPYYLE